MNTRSKGLLIAVLAILSSASSSAYGLERGLLSKSQQDAYHSGERAIFHAARSAVSGKRGRGGRETKRREKLASSGHKSGHVEGAKQSQASSQKDDHHVEHLEKTWLQSELQKAGHDISSRASKEELLRQWQRKRPEAGGEARRATGAKDLRLGSTKLPPLNVGIDQISRAELSQRLAAKGLSIVGTDKELRTRLVMRMSEGELHRQLQLLGLGSGKTKMANRAVILKKLKYV